MSVLMQGTQLYALIRGVIHEIERITNFNPGTDLADQIEDTCLSERNNQTYKEGLRIPGQASVTANIDPVSDSRYLMRQLVELGEYQDELTHWAIGRSGGELVSTVSAGEMALLTDRTWYTLRAYVSDFPFDSQGNTVVSTATAIQRSGQGLWVRKAQPGS